MKLVFMGSPEFAVAALRALVSAGHDLLTVYCQPPRPAGRGHAVRRCAVHVTAEQMGLPVRFPAKLKGDRIELEAFARLKAEAAVVAAYGLIIPAEWLIVPERGFLNIHASLLPRWRGAAPIQAAILAGDAKTGVTIMQMDKGLDTGPILLTSAIPIGPETTATELHDQLANVGASLVIRALAENPTPIAQTEAEATYAPRLRREDGRIDFGRDAPFISRQVRALNPWPGTFAQLGTETLKVLGVIVSEGNGPPGTVLDDKLLVACGSGAVRITRLQRPGHAALEASDFLRGYRVGPGRRFE